MAETLIQITWHDAHSVAPSWVEKGEIDNGPCVVVSIGWLIPNSKPDHIVIAQSYNDSDAYDHVLAIPEKMIVSSVVFPQGVV